ncbi:sensor histidine kinase [Campylobacter sp. RM12651]|uniref:ATP-binding protein n=1 Tax=Campylobacter sp. RM12651 TaxID=1660079 RepID=UPI001EFBA1ED|nr:sensor histidine kinase [Campylobacter sp. RM12651]ULO03246.1 two-component system sensor histidine kinase [Campylobacter sp. RM12651]
MRLFTKITLTFFLISFIVLSITSIFIFIQSKKLIENEITHKIEAISKTLAKNININNPNLNEDINTLSKELNLDFIVIIDKNQKRLTHPNKDLIGTLVEGGDAKQVLNGGGDYISIAKGSLKRSIRSFSPIYKDNQIIGAVIVGVFVDYLNQIILEENKYNFVLIIIFIIIILILAKILNKNIKNILLGYEPKQIASLVARQNAILQSLNDGIIAVDDKNTITLINDKAKDIFKLALVDNDLIGKNANIIPHSNMQKVLNTKIAELNQEQILNEITILTNRIPYFIDNNIAGVVASFKDIKEVKKLANELIDVKKYAEALRANHHEFSNKLHIINALLENNNINEAKNYCDELILKNKENLNKLLCNINDKVILAFCESKFAFAKELKININLNKKSFLDNLNDSNLQNDIISILSNLINNSIDALSNTENKNIEIFIKNNKNYLKIQCKDNGCGIQNKENLFTKGYSTKGEFRGYGLYLCAKIVANYDGTISVSKLKNGSSFSVILRINND